MNLFQQGDFLISPDTTPEMLQAKRDRLAALMPQYGKAQYIGEGLGQLFNGIGTGRQNKAMDAFQGDRSAEAAQQFAAATGGPMSILGMRQQEQPTAFNPDPTAPTTIGNDTMAALGKPSNNGGLQQGIIETAQALGIDPADLATAISYETAGTFDPTKAGPTTQWGQHRGLIQFGEPQAAKYGVDWNDPIGSQLGANGAVAKYLQDTGVKPGMGMMDIYSAINAGGVGRYGASDANNGGAPGTVADKVNSQMAGHRQKAMALLGGEYTPANAGAPTQGQPMQGGQDMDALLQAQANPWLTQSQRAVLDGMISQRQSQQAAAEERYWRQNDPAYQQGLIKGQLEIDAMRNPAPQKRDTQFIKGIGLVDSQTGETVNDFGGTGGGSADGTEYGLTPQYGTDKDGNLVLIQLAKDGTAKQTMLPDGVALQKGVEKLDLGTSFQWYNTVTGEAIGEKIPKDNRGAASETAIGAVTGKAEGENIAASESDVQAAQNALDLIQSLRDDPDRIRGTGVSAMLNGVPGTRGFNYQQKVDQAKGGAFLSAIQQMRGMGALSNNEGSAATAAVARINTAMTEDAFLAALDDYEKIVKQGMERAKRNGAGQQAAPQAPPQDGTQNNDPLGLFQ